MEPIRQALLEARSTKEFVKNVFQIRTSSGLQSEHLAVEVVGVGRTKKRVSM